MKKIDKQKICNLKQRKVENNRLIYNIYDKNYNWRKCMKSSPSKTPQLYNHIYKLINNKNLFKDNETYIALNKTNIPIVFYNHLMTDTNKNIQETKNKYRKVSITQRNKKKLITIIYYTPKQYNEKYL